MKKLLFSVFALALAGYGTSHALITVNCDSVPQPVNDTAMFALPVNPEISQEIWTAVDYVNPVTGKVTTMQVGKFQPEYLVTAEDFTHGDVTLGTPTLPKNAKVIGLALPGFDIGSKPTSSGIVYHLVSAWCRNIARDQMVLDYLDLYGGYNTHLPQGDLFTDTVNNRSSNGRFPGITNVYDLTADSINPCNIVDLHFGTYEEPNIPFWYQGENIYLTLWLINHGIYGQEGMMMKYKYMAYDNAEAQYASLMRSGNFCFNSETQHLLLSVFGQGLPYELPEYRLPAFRTPYYTNDARITCKGFQTLFELRDPDGNVLVPDYVGVTDEGYDYYEYRALNHTWEYDVYTTVGGDKYRGSIGFADIYSDVNVVIDNTTAVEEIDVNKTVSSVVYYNVAGQQSAQAMDGVNIVVTTYSDGSTTTAKVIK